MVLAEVWVDLSSSRGEFASDGRSLQPLTSPSPTTPKLSSAIQTYQKKARQKLGGSQILSLSIMSVLPPREGVCSKPAMEATVRQTSRPITFVTLHAAPATTLPSIFGRRLASSSVSESASMEDSSTVALMVVVERSLRGEGIGVAFEDATGSCG